MQARRCSDYGRRHPSHRGTFIKHWLPLENHLFQVFSVPCCIYAFCPCYGIWDISIRHEVHNWESFFCFHATLVFIAQMTLGPMSVFTGALAACIATSWKKEVGAQFGIISQTPGLDCFCFCFCPCYTFANVDETLRRAVGGRSSSSLTVVGEPTMGVMRVSGPTTTTSSGNVINTTGRPVTTAAPVLATPIQDGQVQPGVVLASGANVVYVTEDGTPLARGIVAEDGSVTMTDTQAVVGGQPVARTGEGANTSAVVRGQQVSTQVITTPARSASRIMAEEDYAERSAQRDGSSSPVRSEQQAQSRGTNDSNGRTREQQQLVRTNESPTPPVTVSQRMQLSEDDLERAKNQSCDNVD